MLIYLWQVAFHCHLYYVVGRDTKVEGGSLFNTLHYIQDASVISNGEMKACGGAHVQRGWAFKSHQ